jgi:hypothetical protein
MFVGLLIKVVPISFPSSLDNYKIRKAKKKKKKIISGTGF